MSNHFTGKRVTRIGENDGITRNTLHMREEKFGEYQIETESTLA